MDMEFIHRLTGSIVSKRDAILIIVLGALLLAHLLHQLGLHDQLIIIAAAGVGVLPVFINALKSLWQREWASMDTLASLALIFSMIEREWASALFISLMLAAARFLETVTKGRLEASIRGLLKLKPKIAKVSRDGKLLTIATEEVLVGDLVIVDAGERIAVDGVIVAGAGAVDESSLTGESLPVDKTLDSTVSSSTLVLSGSITIKTLKIGKDTMIERIITLVESSRKERPQLETLGEKFGKIYLITIFVSAAAILLFTHNAALVLSLVLVVCADDVVIAIPLTYLRAISTAAKYGIIIKGSLHLEVLGRIDTIVFDKTGTLTYGRPQVAAAVTLPSIAKQTLLELTSGVAARSTHPLSKAVSAYAIDQGVHIRECESAEVIGGKGIVAHSQGERVIMGSPKLMEDSNLTIDQALLASAEVYTETGKSITYVAHRDTVIGFFAFGDEIKEDAKSVIAELHTLGVKNVVLLSGDNERAAGALAKEVGVDAWHANLLPEDKVSRIKELSTGHVVAMVGDGVNDAAALSIAHVGIAMGGLGSDGAIESANIVLMHDNLSAIPDIIRLAHQAKTISLQDFWIWGISNVIGVTLVFAGFIGPAGAAAYNFISDFFPLLNSLRTKFVEKK
jgi:Zn2+/Cd2+-exporting ATPase